MNKRQSLLFSCLLLGVLVTVGCLPPPTEPTELRFDVGSKPVEIQPNDTCRQLQPPEKVEIENYWVKNQVIISGDAAQVKETVGELARRNVELTLRTECQLGKLPTPAEAERAGKQLYRLYTDLLKDVPDPANLGEMVQQLYQINNSEVWTVVETIAGLQRERQSFVFADPNYVYSPSGNGVCSNPNGVGSSPFELGILPNGVGSSPNGVGSSPSSGPGIITDTAQADQFMNQWAFEQLALKDGPSKNKGAGIPVLIFDTSPYIGELAETQWQTRTLARPQIDPFVIHVWHPQLPTITPTTEFTPTPYADEHGLFVAGLVHAVAPNSPIHLIRVLNEAGCGDLNTLTTEFWNYVWTNRYGSQVVINLSLGADGATVEDTKIFALNNALIGAGIKGAVFVSAAGNSAASSGQIPAGENYVIGVAASTSEGTAACFSNAGDIAAPGGDGGPDNNENSCGPLSNLHCTDAACVDIQMSHNLMSLVTQTDPTETGFAYWAGTSFATPLVSGMAARLRSDGITPQQTITRLMSSPPQGCAYLTAGGPLPDPILGQGIVQLDDMCQ